MAFFCRIGVSAPGVSYSLPPRLATGTKFVLGSSASQRCFTSIINPSLSSLPASKADHLLTLSCPDKSGIVHAVTGLLAEHNLNILDLQQFSDPISRKFFMRVHFGHAATTTRFDTHFRPLAQDLAMDYDIRPTAHKPRVLVMVSKIGHCLNDLLYRQKTSQLGIEIPLIVSNHADFAPLAATYGIPFHHLPVSKDTKIVQEKQILSLIAEHSIDLVVLARYMQVLTPGLCGAMSGKIINIHHSFLPSFKGAKPYHQAYDRGVKIIGATAHFVTADLDEGPIIEQRVVRVDHSMDPRELVEEGSNVESQIEKAREWGCHDMEGAKAWKAAGCGESRHAGHACLYDPPWIDCRVIADWEGGLSESLSRGSFLLKQRTLELSALIKAFLLRQSDCLLRHLLSYSYHSTMAFIALCLIKCLTIYAYY
nr:formyltetrahydrofolate deformylase [Quercus suber]